jgi:hypothetical protein
MENYREKFFLNYYDKNVVSDLAKLFLSKE